MTVAKALPNHLHFRIFLKRTFHQANPSTFSVNLQRPVRPSTGRSSKFKKNVFNRSQPL